MTSNNGVDYDPTAPESKIDSEKIFADLRGRCPVHHHVFPADDYNPVETDFTLGRPPDFWSLLKYDDVRMCLTDTDLFSSRTGNALELMKIPEGSETLVFADGAAHRRSRKLTQSAVSPKVVKSLVPMLKDRVDDLLDRLGPQGRMDVMADFALPLTVGMLQYFLNVPDERRDQLTEWAFGILGLGSADPAAIQRAVRAMTEIAAFVTEVAPERSQAGTGARDAISMLLTAEDEQDGRLDVPEVASIVTQLIAAGFETSATAITNGVYLLCSHPAELSKLVADPSLIGLAVEEVLRYMAPAEGVFRMTSKDLDVNGRRIPEGSKVRVVLASANLDESKFVDASSFRVDRERSEVSQHMAFGAGLHTCIGNTLARQELKLAFEGLFGRFPDISIDGSRAATKNPEMLVNGLDHLYVTWDPASVRERTD